LLEVIHLSKTYGTGSQAVRAVGDVSFEVPSEEFVCIVGPSGGGKTTLLKCLSGLLTPTSGSTTLAGREVTSPPPEMALVFQEYTRSLFPWMSVHDNIALPLREQGLPRAETRQRVEEALASVDLPGVGAKYPWQLSGGMQQRVAIARAVAYRPSILLMDEPFASVDAQTRADLEDLILRVKEEHGVTALLVTHDIDEAIYLSDRVIVLSSSPSEVMEIVKVDLPRPRDQITTKADPRFAELRTRIFHMIEHSSPPSARTTIDQPA
jgi:NitT/TauT family transport system ATP-binding protein